VDYVPNDVILFDVATYLGHIVEVK